MIWNVTTKIQSRNVVTFSHVSMTEGMFFARYDAVYLCFVWQAKTRVANSRVEYLCYMFEVLQSFIFYMQGLNVAKF